MKPVPQSTSDTVERVAVAPIVWPRELAILLMAQCAHGPRQRARDQQADRAGIAMKQRILARLAEVDPDPECIEMALAQIVDEFGEPRGPLRALASDVLTDWHAARTAPEFMTWLLRQAVSACGAGPRAAEAHCIEAQ
jgi:hypothetical protein